MDEVLYDRFAELNGDHWWFEARRRILHDVLAEAIAASPAPLAEPPAILEVGCGTGGMFDALTPLGSVTGMDMSPEVVEFCREQFGSAVTVQVGRVPDDLPDDGPYDVLGAFDVLEHLEDDVGALARMRSSVKPGGIVIVAVPAFQSLWGQTDVLSHHVRRYRAPQLRRAMEAAGLEIDRMTYFNTWLFPIVAAIRIGRRVFSPADREPQPDIAMTPRWLDRSLTSLFASERHVVRRRSLPFGVSLVAVARRPMTDPTGE